ncbi:MAG: hypothetical protein EOP83_13025 [Verrucomicrobiaceae bacterium]|nr:MAG: hypothetical protein EOP83_13025 [Verrucomicrobiaceae bacterium]
MPYSPFTRFLACMLVALTALAFFWPDDRTLEWAWRGTAGVVILILVFTWSVVKNSPPLDDRAFHQCLPEGLNRAFFRILWIHLLVLAAVALVVVVYCGIWNFSWRAASWGVVMLTIPAWVLMSAVGVASSAGSSQQHRKSVAWFVIFGSIVASTGVLYLLNRGVDRYDWRYTYFTPIRTVLLTAATLYPLCWWLIAARKRRTLGLVLGGATSALLPWLVLYGDFVKAPDREFRMDPPATAAAERLILSRKPFVGSDSDWIPVEDLIDVQGLAEGEQVRVAIAVDLKSDQERGVRGHEGKTPPQKIIEPVRAYEIRDTRAVSPEYSMHRGQAIASNQGGKIVWGADAVGQGLRKQLPPVESFEYMQAWRNLPSSPPVVRNPAASNTWDVERPNVGPHAREFTFYDRLNATTFRAMPWTVSITNPVSWKLQGSCLASEGTSFRLKPEGKLKIYPLIQNPDGNDVLSIRCYREGLWQNDEGPWFGDDAGWDESNVSVAIVAIDETGKHAYLMDEFYHGKAEKAMLGGYQLMSFNLVDSEGAADQRKRVEALRKSRLYVFTSEGADFSRRVELPAAKLNR